MITIAMIGLAHIHAPEFVRKLAARQDVRVRYVWDFDRDRAHRTADALGARVPRARVDVWEDLEVAGAVVCSETNRHARLVREGTDAGKHLFIEKPLGKGARDARDMAARIRASGVIFSTGYAMRSVPAHLAVRDAIRAGHMGTVTRARASVCHQGSLAGWFDTEWRWMANPKIAGVGAFGDLGTHGLDLLMWLLGPVRSVTADIAVVTGRYGDCDERGEGLLAFDSGAVATLAAAWVDVANPMSLMVSGTKGHAAIIDGQLYLKSDEIEGADGKTPWTALPPSPGHPLDLWLDAVGGRTGLPLVGVDEAADACAVMEAMYAAARKRKWVAPK
jgi:predicted dehydrogenase